MSLRIFSLYMYVTQIISKFDYSNTFSLQNRKNKPNEYWLFQIALQKTGCYYFDIYKEKTER